MGCLCKMNHFCRPRKKWTRLKAVAPVYVITGAYLACKLELPYACHVYTPVCAYLAPTLKLARTWHVSSCWDSLYSLRVHAGMRLLECATSAITGVYMSGRGEIHSRKLCPDFSLLRSITLYYVITEVLLRLQISRLRLNKLPQNENFRRIGYYATTITRNVRNR